MSLLKWVGACLVAVSCGSAPAQDHPALAPPEGFAVSGNGDERTFTQTVPNGDRLRIHVRLSPSVADVEAIAKGPALEEGDQIRPETRQEIRSGALSGVSYSVFGKTETLDGIAYTRYRRAMGLRIDGNPVSVATRADILAKEPKPAQSTLEAMRRALTAWQQRLGGVPEAPPPDPAGDPASKPAIGGDQVIRLAGGGDLEIQVPAFWGRADLNHGPGHEEIILGPARDVLEKTTVETISKEKDRIGPYVSITRIQKDTFKDLVDVQLLDIKESLLADYVARMAESGITLTLQADRDEGTLGTRTVISVPFEETRASGTRHRGRSVFMMHRGSLVIVTASHPVEKFDEGWPDIAKAFDTLLFTGAAEPDGEPAAGESRPSGPPTPEPSPEEPAKEPAREPAAAGQPRAAAPAGWTKETRGALKSVEIPVATPVALSVPASWTVLGAVDPAKDVQVFQAAPSADAAGDPLASGIRVEYFAFREDLAAADGLSRLGSLMRLRLEQDARALGMQAEVVSTQTVSLAGRSGVALQYTLRGSDRGASGTVTGTVVDGTVVVADLRIAGGDETLTPLASEILGSFRVTANDSPVTREIGAYGVAVPAGWEVNQNENPAGGMNVFLRAPSGVDVRFQTAIQKRQDVVDIEVLRRVATGFLVEGLKVLTLKDMALASRFLPPAGRPGLRIDASTPPVNVLVLAYMQGDHMIFALRGAPQAYAGRDLALAWQAMRSFAATNADRSPRPDPVPVAGRWVARRVAFARVELDAVAPDGSVRQESSLFVALLPDGSAGVAANRNGRSEDLRGTYTIDGGEVTIEGPGLGRMVYRLSGDGETLQGQAPGDVLFRARHEETP